MAAVSAVPYLVVAFVIVGVLSVFSIRRLVRAVRPSMLLNDSVEAGTEVFRCGFALVQPGRVTSSFGTCTARISDSAVAVRTAVGDYQWKREHATAAPARRKLIGYAIRMADGEKVADVLVLNVEPLAEALMRHGWIDAQRS